jgi:hypothetical protein
MIASFRCLGSWRCTRCGSCEVPHQQSNLRLIRRRGVGESRVEGWITVIVGKDC